MTANEKAALAMFFDTAGAFLRDGHRQTGDVPSMEAFSFEDDPPVNCINASAESSAIPIEIKNSDSLEKIAEEIRLCSACNLCSVRILAVPGEGADKPAVLVIGEAPGADEDASGRPFVGKAGQLLDRMLAAIGLNRKINCFIANTVKCRPPGNRDPQPEETAACAPFLARQICLLQPRFILCVGRIAAQTLLATDTGIGKLRGHFFDYQGIPLIPTYHPSALLRNESLKRPAWEDLKKLKERLEG
jgi:DNA polymerase